MSDTGDNKYKWTPESTSLLVSVWTDNQVQKQLEYTTKPELIWESIAHYMKKKGYNVTGKQCRSRMKRVLVCYRESKRVGTRGGVEQFYDSIDRVLQSKKNGNNIYSVDTVDSAVKSPSKDIKTNKNLQMRHKFQEPANSLYRTNALTPTWIVEKDQEYPDSPESNETVLAQPCRVFSPVRDAATNTRHQLTDLTSKMKRNILPEEVLIKDTIKQNHLQNYFNELPLQNAVQNVQNQIIQENMQQNQALLQQTLLQKRILEQNLINPLFQQPYPNGNQTNYATLQRQSSDIQQTHVMAPQNVCTENPTRIQNQFQKNCAGPNQAMPQEPRKSAFTHNFMRHNYVDLNHIDGLSPSCSPDNLNDAFCQTREGDPRHNLNETFNQPNSANNGINLPNIDNTMMTNNATFNDDTLSIEFLQDSSSVSDNERPKSKDCSVNTDVDLVPSAPFRKKKQQKMEQLMLNAINSQSDNVNKIISAQTDMVNHILDLNMNRQNRLEDRLDQLIDVVRATVLTKNERDTSSHSLEPLITNLLPPPKPGTVPPKLDLVPPKPCRVPCTIANGNIELINQNTVTTRPGCVSPILSPTQKKPGAIWAKLGPVSTSPFVRAQQQLGFPVNVNTDARTKSSAERRIAKDLDGEMNLKTLVFETMAFIEMEKQIVEKVENARLQSESDSNVRRRLFALREPTVAMVLTSAFLEAEKQSQEIFESARIAFEKTQVAKLKKEFLKAMDKRVFDDEILRGQGENFEKMKEIEKQKKYIEEPCDSSTPAKFGQKIKNEENEQPRPNIQQLAQLVMNSARWRDPASARRPPPFNFQNIQSENPNQGIEKKPTINCTTLDSNTKTMNWIQDRYSYPEPATNTLPTQKVRFSYNEPIPGIEPLGFVDRRNDLEVEKQHQDYGKHIGFVDAKTLPLKKRDLEDNGQLEQLRQLYFQSQKRQQLNKGNMLMARQSDLIHQYAKDVANKGSDSDTDEEFLDTTATMQPRRGSITSGTSSKASKADKCVIS